MSLANADFRQLIPLLHPRTRVQDMDVLKAWYAAVADALRPELPAELFALWIYAPGGEPILIEPEALEADHLEVPRAEPLANQMLLDDMEARIRRAGYGSVLLRPIRHGGEDAGLILLASFTPHIYGMRAEGLLDAATDVMGPMLGRVTRASVPVEELPGHHLPPPDQEGMQAPADVDRDHAREGELFEALADAISGAGTPRDLMLALSFAMQPILPHDAYELLIPDSAGDQYYRLGLHGHGVLWGEPELVVTRDVLDPIRLIGEGVGRMIADTEASEETRIPVLVTVRGEEVASRSLIAVPLRVVERRVGFLILGSSGPDFYHDDDLALLDRVGGLLATRVDSLVLSWQYSVLKSQFDVLRHIPMHLARVAELLAGTPFLGEGSKRFVELAGGVLPLVALEFAIRLADEQRVAVVRPGSTTALADLPQEPIEGTGVAQVVRGEVPFLLTTQEEDTGMISVLVVPLRTGGRILGAMAMTAQGSGVFSRTDMALAQMLADLVAPHLDLARRAGGQAPPFVPGWKRPTFRPERERNSES